MKIVRLIALCAAVGVVLLYSHFLIKWADEDRSGEQRKAMLMRMHQQEKKLQKLPE